MRRLRPDSARAAARTAAFFLKVLPIPSRPVNWLTPGVRVERVAYPTPAGEAEGDLYLPARPGPYPAMVVGLGVVPFGVDHPQVPRLGEALARSGFAALLYWSPAMRDFRLDPADVATVAQSYARLVERPDVDAARSGLLGTCVGGAFALMAAADPSIRDRVGFVAAFAPYASMHSFALDVASATRGENGARRAWPVDPLTRRVFVHSMTDLLAPDEARALRDAFAPPSPDAAPGAVSGAARLDGAGPAASLGDAPDALSADGAAVRRVLAATGPAETADALAALPAAAQERLDALSPVTYLDGLRAPLIAFGHDRNDLVIPVEESRRLRAALAGRPGVRYTEFDLFQHVAPRRLPPVQMARELGKFFGYVYPMFRVAVDGRAPA